MKFPSEFFKTEERDGFTVPEMMKRAWSAEMEVLQAVDSVCTKHNIHYSVVAGTLLGAVRHRGFIPWDDDIDIAMLRDDYDRFLQIAHEALPAGFVVGGMHAKERRLWSACEFPNTRIVADELHFSLPEYMTYFHGYPYLRVGIDLFPYDYMPADLDRQYEILKTYYTLNFTAANISLYRQQDKLEAQLRDFEQRFDMVLERADDEILFRQLRLIADGVISSCKNEDCEKIINAQFFTPPERREDFTGIKGRPAKWYRDIIELPFENITVKAPAKYKEILEQTYGPDYMTPKKFTAQHEYPFYKPKEPEFERVLRESGVTVSVDEFCRNWHAMCGGE